MLTNLFIGLVLISNVFALPPAVQNSRPSNSYYFNSNSYNGRTINSNYNQSYYRNNSYNSFQNYREYTPIRSSPNIFGGENYSNGWQSRPNIYGGYNWYKRY